MLSSYGSSRDLHSPFRSQSPIFLPKPRHLTHRVTLRNPLNTATWWHIVEDNSKTIDRGQTKFTTHNQQWCVNRKQSRLWGNAPSFHKQPVLNIDKPCSKYKQNHGSISKRQCQAGSIYPILVKPWPCCQVMVPLEMRSRRLRSQSPIFLPRPRHLTHRVTLRNPLNTATWWHIVEDNSKTIDRGQTKFTTYDLQWCVNRKQSRLWGHAPSFHKQPVLNIDKPCGKYKQNHGSISKRQCQAGSIYPILVKPRPCCRVMVPLEMRTRLLGLKALSFCLNLAIWRTG